MKRLIGIDFGLKKIGLALSDEAAALAFPKGIIKNDEQAVGIIKKLCEDEEVSIVVVGESFDLKGEPNKIMPQIEEFKIKIEEATGLPVFFEKEFMTSVEARRYSPELREGQKDDHLADASAAALILQRYLDRLKNQL